MQIKQGNNTILCGRIAKDPQIKTFNKNNETFNLLELSIIVGETQEQKAIWTNVNVWGKLADKNLDLKKGDYVHIDGMIEKREYQGETRETVKAQFIIRDNSFILQTKNQTEEQFNVLEPLESVEDSIPF